MTWTNRRLLELFGIAHPIVLAPMANAGTVELAIAAARAGALGSLPCATISIADADGQIAAYRAAGPWPLAVNFFCHTPPVADPSVLAAWSARLARYYDERGIDRTAPLPSATRAPFDDAWCAWVERTCPEVVSFHFGLPSDSLLERVRATGARILSTATTVREARWLAERGCDAIIAQGAEAGGHRGMFLTDDVAAQVGTFALVPQIADAVGVPVIAAGGIADGRGVAAALALGAAGVQIGTAYLRCPEVRISDVHRRALAEITDDTTVITNVLTGRPARGIANRMMRDQGPLDPTAPPFPLASAPLAPLRAHAEARGEGEFSTMWAGQAAALARAEPAFEVTQRIAREALGAR